MRANTYVYRKLITWYAICYGQGMAKINRVVIIRNVNQSLAEKGCDARIRYDAEYKEFQVTYTHEGKRTFVPCDSLTEAISTVLYSTFNGPAYAQIL